MAITTTLADIAAAAGVSTATVSRVMNRKPGVRSSTREAVLRALEQAEYEVPTQLTRNLVAVLVPELSNPSFPQYAQELTQLLFAAGYAAIVCPAGQGGSSEAQYLDTLLDSDVCGIISVSGASADALASKVPYERLLDSRIPSVFINGSPEGIAAPFFCADDAVGVQLAVEHLRNLGHEHIGLAVGQPRFLPTRRKTAAFLALGFDEQRDVVSTEYTADGGARAGRRLLANGHTAIVAGSDVMAMGAIQDAQAQGLNVPGDFSVVGYDDSPITRLTQLTTVRQPVNPISEAAVATLLNIIRGEEVAAGELLFAPDLTIRATTGRP
ncbi:LacI family DNA-binding transcriptional regulator [Tessaracoccus sp. OH4464_COT-324]|uniref:LacI family DNA-binding transcriptional regulator n=1 Tax=Tessaracoccus sp. OH4464_COT-324 TaxID=2491059 RepID=UPI000F63E4DD|nr:LacI family DNA-binding transcriptional regulator [Tessaracoccus sp. OH4464_COT-324]RRD46393.1 LacI family DNA-binding transcriptional regulator [Tessaracoccus sp. OH4464_COT-324]